jgi:hypothetical protein
MSEYSDLLYARPSFLEGMARAFDLGATLQDYNQSSTPEQADALALHSDWAAVVAHLHAARQENTRERQTQSSDRPQGG